MDRIEDRPQPGGDAGEKPRGVELWIYGALSLVALALVIGPVLWLPMRVSSGYNEGWNAFQAELAVSGGVLYPVATELWSNNYPPLSFYIVGALGRVIGDNIIAGRVIALVSMLLVAGLIAQLVRRLGGSRGAALFGLLFFVAFESSRHGAYVALDDPQWLGHAFMTGGLALFVARGNTLRGLLGAAVLMVLGGMVKHLLVAAPVAVTLWLAIYRRGALVPWLVASAALVGAGLGFCRFAHGEAFFQSVLASPRTFSLAAGLQHLDEWFTPLLPAAMATTLVAVRAGSPQTTLFLLYAGVAALVGTTTMSGAGINANAVFDLVIALSVSSALAIDVVGRMLPSREAGFARAGVALALAAPALLAFPRTFVTSFHLLSHRKKIESSWSAEVARVRAIEGPVACETLALCYWAGKAPEIDFFIFGEKLRTGTVSPEQAMSTIEKHRIVAIEVERGWQLGETSSRLPAPVNSLLASRFRAEPTQLDGFAMLSRTPELPRQPARPAE